MATSKAPVFLPANTWVDLYSETSITVGTQLFIHNPYNINVLLTESTAEPATQPQSTPSTRTLGLITLSESEDRQNNSGAIGAWAFSFKDTTIQVETA